MSRMRKGRVGLARALAIFCGGGGRSRNISAFRFSEVSGAALNCNLRQVSACTLPRRPLIVAHQSLAGLAGSAEWLAPGKSRVRARRARRVTLGMAVIK